VDDAHYLGHFDFPSPMHPARIKAKEIKTTGKRNEWNQSKRY
jgi:hypothetical protein